MGLGSGKLEVGARARDEGPGSKEFEAGGLTEEDWRGRNGRDGCKALEDGAYATKELEGMWYGFIGFACEGLKGNVLEKGNGWEYKGLVGRGNAEGTGGCVVAGRGRRAGCVPRGGLGGLELVAVRRSVFTTCGFAVGVVYDVE